MYSRDACQCSVTTHNFLCLLFQCLEQLSSTCLFFSLSLSLSLALSLSVHVPSSRMLWLQVGSDEGDALAQQCAEELGLDWDFLNFCYNSEAGHELLWNDVHFGNTKDPPEEYGLQGLPVVWLGWSSKPSSDWALFGFPMDCVAWSGQLVDLAQSICSMYTSEENGSPPTPPQCNDFSQLKRKIQQQWDQLKKAEASH